MEILQNMDMDKFVIIVPSALIAMYLIITLQKSLSERENKYAGLILPGIAFVVSTVLAFRPLFITEGEGLFLFCLQMWATFNIVTVVFLFPYLRARKQRKYIEQAMAAAQQQESEPVENAPEAELKSE